MAVDTRILFTDLDGTLLNDKKEITPGNRAAVDEALAKGHKIVVNRTCSCQRTSGCRESWSYRRRMLCDCF